MECTSSFSTVISLERAVAPRRLWPYVGPLSAGLGGLALLAGAQAWIPSALFILGGTVLTGASGLVLLQQPALYTVTLALGALGWLAGNAVWLASGDPGAAVPFWIAFLVLTIAGVVANVAPLLTGAAGMGGFKGLGGRFDRRTLLACTPPHRYMVCPALESP
jgi:hypothetical protein